MFHGDVWEVGTNPLKTKPGYLPTPHVVGPCRVQPNRPRGHLPKGAKFWQTAAGANGSAGRRDMDRTAITAVPYGAQRALGRMKRSLSGDPAGPPGARGFVPRGNVVGC